MSTMTTGNATAYDYNNQQQERQRMTTATTRRLQQRNDYCDVTATMLDTSSIALPSFEPTTFA